MCKHLLWCFTVFCCLGFPGPSVRHPGPLLRTVKENSFYKVLQSLRRLVDRFSPALCFWCVLITFVWIMRPFSPFCVGVFQACLPSGSQKQTIKTTGVLFFGNYALKEDTRRHLLQGPHIICHRILVNSILRSQSLSMKISQDFLKLGRSYDPVCPSNFMSDSSLQDWG